MAEVNHNGRKQLAAYIINSDHSQQDTRDWVMTWLDTWCPVDPQLIERVMSKVREAERPKRRARKRNG